MSVPTEHDDEPSTSLPVYLTMVLQRKPFDNGTANNESPVSWKYVVCLHMHTRSSCSFPSTFFFPPFWTMKLLENLSQKNLAPPVPDRILLVSYVSAGSTQSQTSPSFISPPTGPETLCSPSVEHRQSCTLSQCLSVVIARLSYTLQTDCTGCLQKNL